VSKTKKDLASNISHKLGISHIHAHKLVSLFFMYISENHENKINIHNFGTFISRYSPERIGRNPKTREEFKIRGRKKFSYLASETIKKTLN
tara:strand:- start:1647 stop:1919 length:273 start_codon:yes stop_codon:yes gene_type:complete